MTRTVGRGGAAALLCLPMNPTNTYEAPAVERLGPLAELTAAAGDINSDDHVHANNAFSNP